MQRNVDLNFPETSAAQRAVRVAEYDWSSPSIPEQLPSHPDIILAADCVYFEPAFPLLVHTLCQLAPLGEDREILFCWKKRRKADSRFFKMLHKHFKQEAVEDDRPGERAKYEKDSVRLMRLTRIK